VIIAIAHAMELQQELLADRPWPAREARKTNFFIDTSKF
jgi:hypothetical protein